MRTPPLIVFISALTIGIQVHVSSQELGAEPELSSRAVELNLPAECEFQFDFRGSEEEPMGRPQGLAVAPNGNVVVVDGINRRVMVFNPTGDLQFAFGEEGTNPNQFVNPLGVAVGTDGQFLVADFGAHVVKVFDRLGDFLRVVGSPGDGDADSGGELFEPSDVCVAPDGAIFVADSGNARIQVFDPDGNFTSEFGEFGSGDGELSLPRGIAVDREGSLYVADSGNSRIQVFDSSGAFVRKFNSGLIFPFGVSVSDNGIVVVANSLDDGVRVFASAGTPIRNFGSLGVGAGEMSFPEKVAIGRDGAIYVADSDNSRIQVWSQCLCWSASGDIDCSGSVNILDVVAAESHRNGDALNADRVPLGDVNESGDIDADDIDAIGSRVLE